MTARSFRLVPRSWRWLGSSIGSFWRTLLVAALAGCGARAEPISEPGRAVDDVLVGEVFRYTVKRGDSLALVGARFGVHPRSLARANQLPPFAWLRIGQGLRVDNRHLVPYSLDRGILINIPQRLLFLFAGGRLVAWYPVGLGRPDWPTAVGRFRVDSLERQPTWNVPPSIQEEMRRRGVRVRRRVAPGPANPLGDYWIGLESSGCGIHGTNAPASLYTFQTHGCVRLYRDDIADLFSRASRGMTVQFVYEPILLARAADGAVFLEVNPDIYGRQRDPSGMTATLAQRQDVQAALDPGAVKEVIAASEGLARRVDRFVGRLPKEGDLSAERTPAVASDP
jgi:L,D-transpeptidase ErfK/SrfK